MPRTIPSNSDDTIDSRDIIARIEDLTDKIDREEISTDNGATENTKGPNGEHVPDLATCGTCGKTWDDGLTSGRTPTPSARCPYEHIHDEIAELKTLTDLQEQCEGYSPDWRHGATLIRESYFKTFAEQYADDIGAIDARAVWPLDCIDWEQAAEELKMDYTGVEFDGVDYWVR